MAKEVLELEVKSNIKQVTKDQQKYNNELRETKEKLEDVNEEGKEVVAEMQILGLSLNGIKAGFNSAAAGAKFMFRSIRAGIASTGIGLFVIAITSVVTSITRTKKASEQFEVALSGIGAAFNVILDRIALFGGGLIKLFSGDVKGAIKDVQNSFKGIKTEIIADTALTAALTKQTQDLADKQRDLNVETAQRRSEIEQLKLVAEDVTKSEGVRLKAAEDAFKIENDLLNRRIELEEEALRLQQRGMEIRAVDGENTAEDLDREAELEMNLANIVGESTTKQIELNNKINAIKAEILAKRKEEEVIMTKMPELAQESADGIIEADNAVLDNYINNIEERKQLAKDLEDFKYETAHNGLRLIQVVAGEGTALAKSAAIAQATLSGVQGVQNAFTSAAANIPLTTATGGAYPYIQAGFAGAFSLAQIAKMMSGSTPDGGSPPPTTTVATPAPQMMSGAFDLTGGVAPDPLRAFVVTDEMTNSQDQLANIRRRATI
mgnify:FL=1